MIRLFGGITGVVDHTEQRHTNMKQNTVIHILLGVAVLSAIALLYVLLARHGQSGLSPSGWLFFAALCLFLIVAAFAPSLVRRWRGLPGPEPLSPSDIGVYILVTAASCALAFFGVFSGMWWMMFLGFMLPPLWFMFRRPGAQRRHHKG
jgi:predicted metal-binding membrane protein